jgi:hypothetical protein
MLTNGYWRLADFSARKTGRHPKVTARRAKQLVDSANEKVSGAARDAQ